MRFCLSARQSKEYLKKAGEIMVDWRDHDFILDILEINPEATVVLALNDAPDWDKIAQYDIMCRGNFQVCCINDEQIAEAKRRELSFFVARMITDPYTLNALINFGVCAARVGGMLAHQLDYIATLPIEIRITPNYSASRLGYNPIIGSWFRPEDFYQLEGIDVCEFISRDNREEQALYRIYAEQHQWPGPINMIVKDIPDDKITNRMIPPEFQERRSNCAMKCQYGRSCHFCETITYLANPNLLKPLIKKKEEENTKLERGQRADVPGIIDEAF